MSLATSRASCLFRWLTALALPLLVFAAPAARAQMSPELLLMLGEMHGKLLTDFATDQRTGQDCRAEVINITNAALKLRGVQSAGEAAGAVLIKALEHSCKAYLDATGLGAIATTYSLAKCGYEYMADVNDDAGFLMCLLGEAIGKGVDKLGDSPRVVIEESRKVLIGRATDEIVDQAKGLVNDWRNAVGPTETDTTNWTLGDGCEVVLTINWRKASNPVRAMKTQGNAGSIQVHVQIQNCKCSRNGPLHMQLKNGSLFASVPIRFVPNAAQQPSWQADFPRMRTRLNAICCTGRHTTWGDPPRTDPRDQTDGPPPTKPIGVVPGGGATRPPVTSPPPGPPPTSTPPTTPRPPVSPPTPAPPVPMAQACPECVQHVNEINAASAAFTAAEKAEAAAETEADQLDDTLANIRSEVRSLEQQLAAQRGAGGSSFDPETGMRVTAVNNGDGTVTVTTYGPDGAKTGEYTRDVAGFKRMRQELDSLRQREADTATRQAEAKARAAEARVAAARARDRMRAAQAALERCLELCKQKGVPFDPPAIVIGDNIFPVSPTDARIKRPAKPKPGGRKGPGGGVTPPRAEDPPARANCEACQLRASQVDQARANTRQTDARIERVRSQMHALTGEFVDGTKKLTPQDSERFGELKRSLRDLETELRTRESEQQSAETALAECNKTCATAEGPKIAVQPPGGGGGQRPPRVWPPLPTLDEFGFLPEPPAAACTMCQRAETEAYNVCVEAASERKEFFEAVQTTQVYRDLIDGKPFPGPDALPSFKPRDISKVAAATADEVAQWEPVWAVIAQRNAEAFNQLRADCLRAIAALNACNRRCVADVSVDKVIGVVGGNPWNPTDPTGGPGGGGGVRPPGNTPGTLQFSSANYGGGEGGAVLITVTRQGGATGRVSVDYVTQSGSATSGSDFAFRSGPLIWNDGDASPKFITVPLIDDTAVEGPEAFSVNLLNVTGGATIGSPSVATVTIADNDAVTPPQPAGTLQLSASSYTTTEGQGPITITATRTGGSAGQVGVTLNTGPSSAVGGQDYTPVTITFIWENGDTAPKTVLIPILDDTTVEGPETFFVNLNNPTGGATLGTPATATVTINDNDVATGPCGAQGNAWQGNTGAPYSCFGSCSPNASSPTVTVNGDIVTVSSFHAGGAATFQGCGSSLNSQSSTLTYFSQSNHTAVITRSSNTSFSANITSSGGGSCSFTCSR
ncbi:MAG: hypothetical protein JNM76_02120 [Betaproteobacteria bacterium]|nr:hypothetical protein [Betaproteobacteria bacterium]